jgi:hypothetical protein
MVLDHALAAVQCLAPQCHLLLGSHLLQLLVRTPCSSIVAVGVQWLVRSPVPKRHMLHPSILFCSAHVCSCACIQDPGLAVASTVRQQALHVLHAAMLQATERDAQVQRITGVLPSEPAACIVVGEQDLPSTSCDAMGAKGKGFVCCRHPRQMLPPPGQHSRAASRLYYCRTVVWRC